MISVLCPTRARPKMYARMARSLFECSTGPVELLAYIDADDPYGIERYEAILPNVPEHCSHRILTGDGEGVGQAWNIMANVSDGNLLMMGNDDLVWHTEGWDERVSSSYASAFPDDLGLLWCNDLLQGRKHCAFPIVSRRWVETLGYFVPEVFNFFFHDTWVYDIAKLAGRAEYLDEVVVEHRHWTRGKMKPDETTKRNRQDMGLNDDKRTYDAHQAMRGADAQKIMEAIACA